MRIVGLIPAMLGNDKVPFQNIKKLGGIPLVNYTVRVMNNVPLIDDIVIYASSDEICKHIINSLKYRYIKRPIKLDDPITTSADIISSFLERNDADIIIMWHITSPFLRPETIIDCLEKVISGAYDSAFTAYEIKKFCWYSGKPLNYSLTKPTPRTQDIEPVIIERAHLYVFRTDSFKSEKQRIAILPYIKIIDAFEGHDIDTPQDFKMAELIVDTGFFDLK